MDGAITDSARDAMLRAAVAGVDRVTLTAALARADDPHHPVPTPVANALHALRRHRDPAAVIGKVQYRATLPYAAAVLADACLAATVEVLGEDADEPDRAQLLAALDQVVEEHGASIVTVMLASVADSDMPSSDLCFDLLAADPRWHLAGWEAFEREGGPAPPGAPAGAPTEQREARRERKRRETEARRRRAEADRRADEQRRARRRRDRPGPATGAATRAATDPTETGHRRPTVTRRAVLTPAQEEEFDRGHPWVGGLVKVWVPYAAGGVDDAGERGKVRPSVVVAGSATQLLVRPGYSEGGMKSRDWKAVPLAHWRHAGLDQATWVDVETVRVELPEAGPFGRLSPEDWNALW